METKTFYITTPIYYVNANPHLGHAYSTVVCDALARFHKLRGEDVRFLTGTDEHGDKIAKSAAKQGRSPQEFVDEISSHFRNLWPKLDIQNDYFMRTTNPEHVRLVQKFLQKVYDNGDIYFGEFGGHYCTGCERFYTEKELVNGLCPQHLTKPEYIKEKNYFFRMSKYMPWLRQYVIDHPDLVRPERYRTELLGLIDSGGLEDLCISRPKSRLSWGIELPFDKDYVTYVWFDALLNYITALGWPDGPDYKKYWPGEHLVAKDILKPHGVFWPCMLHSAGLPVYQHLNVHGYWLMRDTKMSKSLGNVVHPERMIELFGSDAFRYFMLAEMHFGSDANFNYDALITRINSDLANDLGNLFSRVLTMTAKYENSVVPQPRDKTEEDRAITDLCSTALRNFSDLFGNVHFARAIDALWELVRALNKYVDTQAPWALAKEGKTERLKTVLYVLLASMRKVALALWPVMPHAATIMLQQLGEEIKEGEKPNLTIDDEIACFGGLYPGTKVAASSNIFPRIDTKAMLELLEKESKAEMEKAAAAKKVAEGAAEAKKDDAVLPNVTFDQFKACDLRVGTVKVCEKLPKSDRILRLMIDFAEGQPRQILSGLAEFYKPEELVGRQVIAALNLEPRKIRGAMSNGMVLTAEKDGKLTLIAPSVPMPDGSRIG